MCYCVWMCAHECVCTHTGEPVECLMEGHYILVSSASVRWVWNAAALAPRTPVEPHPKDPLTPQYIRPSLPHHPSLPPLDLCLCPSVCYFISLSLDSLFHPKHARRWLRGTLLKNCKLWIDVYSLAAARWIKRDILETASASISCCNYLSFTSAQTSCCLLEHFKS